MKYVLFLLLVVSAAFFIPFRSLAGKAGWFLWASGVFALIEFLRRRANAGNLRVVEEITEKMRSLHDRETSQH